jgi:hypothetical protein
VLPLFALVQKFPQILLDLLQLAADVAHKPAVGEAEFLVALLHHLH